jgi:hypothetical protein
MVPKILSSRRFRKAIGHNPSGRLKAIYSKYEDPIFRTIMEGTLSAFKRPLKKFVTSVFNTRVIPNVVIGSLPDASYNAAAFRVPGQRKYVIIFNWGLFNVLTRVSKILVRIQAHFPLSIKIDLSESSWADKYEQAVMRVMDAAEGVILAKAFAATFLDYHHIPHELDYDVNSINNDLTSTLNGVYAVGAERFVLAHEIAHVMCGHLDTPESTTAHALPDGNRVEICRPSHKDEILADLLGDSLASMAALHGLLDERRKIISHELLNHRLVGSYFFFICAEMIEYTFTMFNLASKISDTHPPLAQRIELVMAQARSRKHPNFEIMVEMLKIKLEKLLIKSIPYWEEVAEKRLGSSL